MSPLKKVSIGEGDPVSQMSLMSCQRPVTLLARDPLTSGGEPWPTLGAASNLSHIVFFVFFPFFIFLLESGGKQPMLSLLKKMKNEILTKENLTSSGEPATHVRLAPLTLS